MKSKLKNIPDLINSCKTLTPIESEAAAYIHNHMSEIPDMSIRELSEKTYVASGTILRICKKLGFQGYRDFKDELIKELEAYKYTSETINFDQPFQTDTTDLSVFRDMAALYKETIDILLKNLNQEVILQAANLIESCHVLYIYAVGDSQITAEAFANRLSMLGRICEIATARMQHRAYSNIADGDDAALIISYGGNWEMINENAMTLKKRAVPVISITSNDSSIIYKAADCAILIPPKETDSKISTFYSQIAFSYVLNVIYSLIYQRMSRHS